LTDDRCSAESGCKDKSHYWFLPEVWILHRIVNACKTALGFGPALGRNRWAAEGSREYLHFSGLSVVDGAVPTNRAPLFFLCHPEMTNTLWLDEKVEADGIRILSQHTHRSDARANTAPDKNWGQFSTYSLKRLCLT
jgi:hypothetical protein